MLEYALQYIARSWAVFPLAPGAKVPLKGSHGHLDATTDRASVEAWWTARPQANIGLRCGSIVVIDLDGPGAIAELQGLVKQYGALPRTLTAQTSRGYHLYFRAPAGVTIRTRNAQRAVKGGDGIDVKGEGGFVLLPPSHNRRSGFTYKWALDLAIAEMPQWLVNWCQQSVDRVGGTAFHSAEHSTGARLLQAIPAHIAKRHEALAAAGSSSLTSKAVKSFNAQWSAQEEARVISALASIPADCSRDEWLHVGMALHALDWQGNESDRGFDLWLEWSRTGKDKFQGEFDCETRWNSFGRRGGVSIGSLFHYAAQHGWSGSVAPHVAATAAQSETKSDDGGGLGVGMNGHAPGAVALAMPAGFNDAPIHFPDTDKVGRPKSTCVNARTALQRLGMACRYDTFHERFLVGGQVLQQFAGELSDTTVQLARMAIYDKYGFDPSTQMTYEAAFQECLADPFDPVCDYLHGLAWDGVPRLATWLHVYLGAEDSRLNAEIGRLALVAAVRRVTVPGTKFDQIIVLEGAEGTNKSTAIQILAGAANFSDQSILLLDDRAQQEALQGVWLYEIADLAGMHRADIERVKAFASRDTDRARPAYGRSRVDRPRRCVFFATTNDEGYLKSQTGNRRFWPVKTGRIDIVGLKRDRDQLWAEAVEADHFTGSIFLPAALWGAARDQQEARREIDPWEDILADIPSTLEKEAIAREKPIGAEYRISSRYVLDMVLRLSTERQTGTNLRRMSQIMQRLGWERATFREGVEATRGYSKKRLHRE